MDTEERMNPVDRVDSFVREMAECCRVLGDSYDGGDNAWFILLGYLYALYDYERIDKCAHEELRNRIAAIANVATTKDDWAQDCEALKRRLNWLLKEKKHEVQTD